MKGLFLGWFQVLENARRPMSMSIESDRFYYGKILASLWHLMLMLNRLLIPHMFSFNNYEK
jgi:hypothetical protein